VDRAAARRKRCRPLGAELAALRTADGPCGAITGRAESAGRRPRALAVAEDVAWCNCHERFTVRFCLAGASAGLAAAIYREASDPHREVSAQSARQCFGGGAPTQRGLPTRDRRCRLRKPRARPRSSQQTRTPRELYRLPSTSAAVGTESRCRRIAASMGASSPVTPRRSAGQCGFSLAFSCLRTRNR
jgi:hypothetical protein